MRVLLVGVSCVGKTAIGAALARRLAVRFYDLDAEIERHFGLSIELLQARFITGYSYRKECSVVLRHIITTSSDCVVALGPSGLRDAFLRVVRTVPCVTVALHDSPENILGRITFYDVDSRPLSIHLSDRQKQLYLREIRKDITYFRRSYQRADLHADITGLGIEASADLIEALVMEHCTVKHDP